MGEFPATSVCVGRRSGQVGERLQQVLKVRRRCVAKQARRIAHAVEAVRVIGLPSPACDRRRLMQRGEVDALATAPLDEVWAKLHELAGAPPRRRTPRSSARHGAEQHKGRCAEGTQGAEQHKGQNNTRGAAPRGRTTHGTEQHKGQNNTRGAELHSLAKLATA